MKTTKFFALVALSTLLVLAGLAQAKQTNQPKSGQGQSSQTLSGDWELSVAAPTGALPVTGTLKQDGDAVSGSLTTPYGPAQVKSGKVTGKQFTITVAVSDDGSPFNATLSGTQDGDKVKGT